MSAPFCYGVIYITETLSLLKKFLFRLITLIHVKMNLTVGMCGHAGRLDFFFSTNFNDAQQLQELVIKKINFFII